MTAIHKSKCCIKTSPVITLNAANDIILINYLKTEADKAFMLFKCETELRIKGIIVFKNIPCTSDKSCFLCRSIYSIQIS